METIRLPKLNLPSFEPQISWQGSQAFIRDLVRKKDVMLTPEEWVRQHFIHLLSIHLHYPVSLMKIERGHTYAKIRKRTDIEILNPEGGIFLLVECKAPEVKLSKATLNQLSIYNQTIKAELLSITNGFQHFVWKKNQQTGQYDQIADFPDYLSIS